MDKIIIANPAQYGYNTDSFKYCEYLKRFYDITYICFDHKLDKFESEDINVIYLEQNKSRIKSLLEFNYKIIKENYKIKPKVIFSFYNPLNFISRIFTLNTRMILDIRSGSVIRDEMSRKKKNALIFLNSMFFSEKTIISSNLAKVLRIKKYKILPLGCDYVEENIEKSYKELNLLYVGTLTNRDIIKTVNAVDKLSNTYNNIKIKYTIIGYFGDYESDESVTFFEKIKSVNVVNYLGRKKHNELKTYFESNNIGVSFVPITEYFNCQPPTKTYEYLSHGLLTIATNTDENKKIINKKNGILCEDSEESFYNSLETIIKYGHEYNSNYIKESVRENDWEYIAKNILIPIIEKKDDV